MYPVKWHPGLVIPEILQDPIPLESIKSQEHLRRLLTLPWGDHFAVKANADTEHFTRINSCKDSYDFLVNNAFDQIETEQYPDRIIFKALVLGCRAISTLVNAQASKQSYFDLSVLFSDKTPSLFPKEFAMIISPDEYRRSKDPSIKYWEDLDRIVSFELQSELKATYEDDAKGVQELKLVGKGDFNGDGIEDLLIMVSGSIIGADYENIRLFAITKKANTGSIELLREINP